MLEEVESPEGGENRPPVAAPAVPLRKNVLSAAGEKPARGNLVLSCCAVAQHGDGPPANLAGALFAFDGRVYQHGGADELAAFGALFSLDPGSGAWEEVPMDGLFGPGKRYGHSLTGCSFGAVLFGGFADPGNGELEESFESRDAPVPAPIPYPGAELRPWAHQGTATNSVFYADLRQRRWERVSCAGEGCGGPSPRGFHAAAVYRASSGEEFLVVWGGAASAKKDAEKYGDLHILDIARRRWVAGVAHCGHAPTARAGHAVAVLSDSKALYLFGGAADRGALYRLDLSPLERPLSGRHEAEQQLDKQWDGLQDENGIEGDPSGSRIFTWSVVEATGGPPASRSFHSLTPTGLQSVLLYGGLRRGAPSDAFVFHAGTCKWSRPLYEEVVDLAGHGAAALTGGRVVVFGGVRCRQWDAQAASHDRAGVISRQLRIGSVFEIRATSATTAAQLKLIVIGDSAVGKSCLLERFVGDVYTDSHSATVGVDFFSLVTLIRGKLVTLQLWDTAGQERFGVVTANYYRNCDGFIFVFDCTRRETFDHVLTWVDRVKEHHDFGSDAFKLLIGNKQDLADQVRVPTDEATRLAESLGAVYLGTSAKTGAGVDTAFLLAANRMTFTRVQQSSFGNHRAPSGHSRSGVTLRGAGAMADDGGAFSGFQGVPSNFCNIC